MGNDTLVSLLISSMNIKRIMQHARALFYGMKTVLIKCQLIADELALVIHTASAAISGRKFF
jgi:hypothetical protein